MTAHPRDELALLRAAEAGPISAMDMVSEFFIVVKNGYIGPDGKLTDKGRRRLLEAASLCAGGGE